MYNKIKEYVFFKLRNDHSTDNLEKKEEIISNISERYDELYQKSNDKEYAYIEAIKTIGEFTEEEIKNEVSYKPEFAEMLLIAATVLSIIGFLGTLFNVLVGLIIVGISITCYAVGAAYLYQFSKFSESEEYDVKKYQIFLDKIFAYMKTNFIFWSLSLSFIISDLIYKAVLMISVTSLFKTFYIDKVFFIYLYSIVISLIALVIIVTCFYNLYKNLMKKYSILSGNDDVKSVGMIANEFIGKSVDNDHNSTIKKIFYIILNGIAFIILAVNTGFEIYLYSFSHNFNMLLFSIINCVLILFYSLVAVLYLVRKIKTSTVKEIFYVISLIILFLIWHAGILFINHYTLYFIFVAIVYIVRIIINLVKTRKKDES